MEALRRRDKESLEEQLRALKERAEEEATKERHRADQKVEEALRRHGGELKLEKERLKIETEEWKAEFLKRQADNMHEFQKRLREEAVKERNKEIAAIIERLGDETHDT